MDKMIENYLEQLKVGRKQSHISCQDGVVNLKRAIRSA